MGLRDHLTKKPSIEEQEDKRDMLSIEEEIVEKESHVAEKKELIRQLKKRHGSAWRHILGVGRDVTVQTLRSYVGNMTENWKNKGHSAVYSPGLDPRPHPRRD